MKKPVSKVKVHIILKEKFLGPSYSGVLALARVLRTAGVELYDKKRFAKYGIITAEISPAKLERLRALPEVESVEANTRKFSLAK